MRNFDRNSGYNKNSSSSSYSRNDRRDDRSDRYYSDDKHRNSSNKGFGGRNDYKKPRRDFEAPRHSYQDRPSGNRSYGGDDRYRGSDHSKSERSFRNHSPPKRSRDVDTRRDSGGFRAEGRRRNMSPPPRRNNDFKPTASTSIKSRLAPLRSRIANSRMARTGGNKIMRRNDLRSGIITKRSTTINRAKDYARKIRQARLKLNEGASTSSSRLKSTGGSKSPNKESEDGHRKNEDNEDDYLAIANDVNFDEDENESTGGKNSSMKDDSKIKEEKEEEVESKDLDNKKMSEEPQNDDENEKKTPRDKKSASRSRTPSKERGRKFDKIEYCCIHCGKRSTSAQEYRSHLSGRRHLLAMREVGLRVRATLNRLRKVQRDKQLEIEARIKDVEDIQSKYCQVCKLNYRQSKEEHRESEDHKKIGSFLKPYCKICRMKLISPMKYEIHRCHTDHIRRKLKAHEGSDDEVDMQEMDIGDFKTVDSVGNVDEDGEMDDDQEESDNVVGMECVKKIEASYCSLCHDFIYDHRHKDADEEEKLLKEHCRTRRHINRYHDHKKDEELKAKAKASKEAQKSSEKSTTKQNGSEEKIEKNSVNEIDRDADVNIDENTNEGSKHSDEED